MMRRLVLVACLAACARDDLAIGPALDRAEPPYAPLAGGTEVVLHGSGFVAGGAAPNRVFIGGSEAPLVRTIDDTRLGVVIPAGDVPGDVEVVLLNRNGNTVERDLLHYSALPEILDVSPTRVLYTSETQITLTGAGFLDEGAGAVEVLVDGVRAVDVTVLTDTELTFTALPGRALAQPDLTVIDARGTATRRRAFRYAPSEHDGLLLFTRSAATFAVFVEPITLEVVPIPRYVSVFPRYNAVVRDERGDYWAVDRSPLRFGRIDMNTLTLENPVSMATILPAATRVGDDYLGIDRLTQQLGRLDPSTGTVTPISTTIIPCCGSFGLARLDDTLYFTARQGTDIILNTIDPATGALGTPVTLTGVPNLHVEEMRAFRGALYATTRTGTLVMIDPVTGTVTTLPITPGQANAMEIFD